MFDSRVVTPVFYGKDVWSKDPEDTSSQKKFDVRISHPACYGYYVEEEGDFKRVEDQEQPVDIKKAVESTFSYAQLQFLDSITANYLQYTYHATENKLSLRKQEKRALHDCI